MIILEITAALVAVGTVLYLIGDRITKTSARKAAELLQDIDFTYSDVVEKRRVLLLAENNTTVLTPADIQPFIDEVFIMLKPDIDALIAHINATNSAGVRILYKSPYFKSIASLAEALYERRHSTPAAMLSHEEEQKIYAAVRDAIQADMRQRLLNWNVENL
jgi:hypothetical protein